MSASELSSSPSSATLSATTAATSTAAATDAAAKTKMPAGLSIRTATKDDIPTISRLANEIWWPTYSGVTSDAQISFMLEQMYSPDSLGKQFDDGISFIVMDRTSMVTASGETEGSNDKEEVTAAATTVPVGFASFSEVDAAASTYKMHKLYLQPSEQGQGAGRALVDEVCRRARESGCLLLKLNVNRFNKAYNFYLKYGFEVAETVDIPYYEFVLNDYVMQKALA